MGLSKCSISLWKILEEMGLPDYITCILRNLYVGHEATVRSEHGTTDWFKNGKGVQPGCILSTSLFNFYAECIMQNTGLDESQAGIKTCQEKYQQSQICKWYHSNGRKWKGTKEPLDEGKEESGKAGLNLKIKTTTIMASSHNNLWQVEKKWKQWLQPSD